MMDINTSLGWLLQQFHTLKSVIGIVYILLSHRKAWSKDSGRSLRFISKTVGRTVLVGIPALNMLG